MLPSSPGMKEVVIERQTEPRRSRSLANGSAICQSKRTADKVEQSTGLNVILLHLLEASTHRTEQVAGRG